MPVYDSANLTRLCLNALLRQSLDETELIVVDDASRDETARLLEGYGELVRVVSHHANTGFATSCNDGAAIARGEHLVFLNNDTMPTQGWLDALHTYTAEHPEAGVVGAKLLFPDHTVQHAGVVFTQDGHPRHVYHGFPADHPAVNKSRRFQCVTAACALVRRDLFDKVGGFDPGFVNGFEDVDLCLRIGELGYESHYCHECVVYHVESATRGWEAAEMDQNYALLRRRWGDRLVPDDVNYYVEDGLIRVRYTAPHDLEIEVSPMIGTAVGTDDVAAATLLSRRSQQVVELAQENEELRRLARISPKPESDLERLVEAGGGEWRVGDVLKAGGIDDGSVVTAAHLRSSIASLSLQLSKRAPQRVNVLVAAEDLDASDERAATLHLGARLVQGGWRVRAVTLRAEGATDGHGAGDYGATLDEEAFAGIEVVDRSDRRTPLVVSSEDVFVAGSWWSAHVAHAAARELGGERFLYVIQGYEPFAFPMGSHAAAAIEAYALPHVALFSTSFLREYFREQKLGVFAEGQKKGEREALVFEPPITGVGEVTRDALARRGTKRLLFDARAGAPAGKNLVEIGLLALTAAVEAGELKGWDFTGFGAPARSTADLADGHVLEFVPDPPRTRYRGLLLSHDIGMSLIHAPNPSGVPIEMASAGMLVVTTRMADETGDALRGISENLIVCAPTVAGVRQGLQEALVRLPDHGARAEAAKVRWSTDWDESFDEATLQAVSRLLRRCVPTPRSE